MVLPKRNSYFCEIHCVFFAVFLRPSFQVGEGASYMASRSEGIARTEYLIPGCDGIPGLDVARNSSVAVVVVVALQAGLGPGPAWARAWARARARLGPGLGPAQARAGPGPGPGRAWARPGPSSGPGPSMWL